MLAAYVSAKNGRAVLEKLFKGEKLERAKGVLDVYLSGTSLKATAKEVDFAKEYHYVIEDLRRIFLTAAALLVLLIVLAVLIA